MPNSTSLLQMITLVNKGRISTIYQRYRTLALDITELNNLNQLPFDIDVDAFQLSEGGLEKVLEDNTAKWHKKKAETMSIVKKVREQKKKIISQNALLPVL